ncbi:MAG: hypothetical protein JWR82_2176 [Blastococcus sp.]|jgi:hypothetical protein|nr:hypothetical protein [Blastococcus sp.]
MRLRGVTGTALLCLSVTGCTGAGPSPADAADGAGPGHAALAEWQPPADAPRFCAELAGAGRVDDLPAVVGHLLAAPADTRLAWRLTQTSGELEGARDAVREESGHAELAAALTDLVDALTVASSGPVEEATIERIADGLAAVGRYAQPACEFPT